MPVQRAGLDPQRRGDPPHGHVGQAVRVQDGEGGRDDRFLGEGHSHSLSRSLNDVQSTSPGVILLLATCHPDEVRISSEWMEILPSAG